MKTIKELQKVAEDLYKQFDKNTKDISDCGKAIVLLNFQLMSAQSGKGENLKDDPEFNQITQIIKLLKGEYLLEMEELDEY